MSFKGRLDENTNLNLPYWVCRRCDTSNQGFRHCCVRCYEPRYVRENEPVYFKDVSKEGDEA